MPSQEQLSAYAELTVRVGVNVYEGQLVQVDGYLEHAPFVRAVARAAYGAGASRVDVRFGDKHVSRAKIELGPDDHLGWTPPWLVKRIDDCVAERGASITVTGDPDPELFADLDAGRVGRARQRELTEAYLRAINSEQLAWTIVAAPTEGWARKVLGEPDVDRLWGLVATTVRLDEDDPVSAWAANVQRLSERANLLNERRLAAVRFRGPGTDLTVGLLERSRWKGGDEATADGRRYVPNLPTEEVFTQPDPTRVDGVVRSTRPLALQGVTVEGLEVRFEGGRAVDASASTGVGIIETYLNADEGARRLGELALVDAGSRVGTLPVTFFETLLDENATSHIALGNGYPQTVEGAAGLDTEGQAAAGVNHSSIHVDFMIGGPEVQVDGIDGSGGEIPLIHGGKWLLK